MNWTNNVAGAQEEYVDETQVRPVRSCDIGMSDLTITLTADAAHISTTATLFIRSATNMQANAVRTYQERMLGISVNKALYMAHTRLTELQRSEQQLQETV